MSASLSFFLGWLSATLCIAVADRITRAKARHTWLDAEDSAEFADACDCWITGQEPRK